MGRKLRAACLAAGLATAWGTEAPATDYTYHYSVDVTPTHALSDVYFLFATGGTVPPNSMVTYSTLVAASIPADGTAHHYEVAVVSSQAPGPDGSPLPVLPWSLGARATLAARDDDFMYVVSLGYDPESAARIIGHTWDGTQLPYTYQGSNFVRTRDVGYTEPQLASALSAGDVATLNAFARGDMTYPWVGVGAGATPATVSLVNFYFGTGTDGGTATITLVPEPGSGAVLLAGAVGLLPRRRRAQPDARHTVSSPWA
jgi:hypothetical protein